MVIREVCPRCKSSRYKKNGYIHIYGWFTEGFDTADLQEAKALLEELVYE